MTQKRKAGRFSTVESLPTTPLRASITKHNSQRGLAQRWANSTGRSLASCNRAIERVMSQPTVTLYAADVICVEALGSSLSEIYGTTWELAQDSPTV